MPKVMKKERRKRRLIKRNKSRTLRGGFQEWGDSGKRNMLGAILVGVLALALAFSGAFGPSGPLIN